MSGHWMAVASAAHVRLGREGGFMQVSHGKAPPLRRIKPGDGIVYYSPSTVIGQKDGLKSLTAIGVVREGQPYQGIMGEGFEPWRRNVDWKASREVPIAPLLDRLDLTRGKVNWGYQLRFGLLALSDHDFHLIDEAMSVG